MKTIMEGNHAVSQGVLLSRAQVIPVYPITPQTHISEELADLVAEGELDARYIRVESEHSAMAACIGASTAGARAFTATSSQGLALMHEMLHWASGARLPIVMANVNRTLGSPWNIWNDQSDSMAQRDTGWLQFYCEDNQEALDSIIMGYMVSERAFVPSMVILDAFILSHTREVVDIPERARVDEILPTLDNPHALDIDRPRAFSPVVAPDHFTEVKYKQFMAVKDAFLIIDDVSRIFEDAFGRSYPNITPHMTDDAEVALIGAGSVCGTIRIAVEELRGEGFKVGMVKVRTFRPFPGEEIRGILTDIPRVGVIDKSVTPGMGGPLNQEVMAALYGGESTPDVTGFIGGLGGRNLPVSDIKDVFISLIDGNVGGDEPNFIGLGG